MHDYRESTYNTGINILSVHTVHADMHVCTLRQSIEESLFYIQKWTEYIREGTFKPVTVTSLYSKRSLT